MPVIRNPRTPLDWLVLVSYPGLCVLSGFGYAWHRKYFYLFGILVFTLRFLFLLITSSADTLLTDVPTLLWGSWGFWFVLEWLHEWSYKVRNRWYRKIFVVVIAYQILLYTLDIIIDYFISSSLDGDQKAGLNITKQVIFAVDFFMLFVGLLAVFVLLRPLLKDSYLSDTRQLHLGFFVLWCAVTTILCVLLRAVFDLLAVDNNFFRQMVLKTNSGVLVEEVLPSLTLLCVQLSLPKTLNPGERVTLLPPKMVATNDLLLDIPMSPLTNRPNLSVRRLLNDANIRKIRSSELQQDEGPLALLGSGSSGVVYKAVWHRPREGSAAAVDIPVAVKVVKLLPQLVAQSSLDKFLLEVILTAQLSRHSDYIVYLHGVVLDRFQEHGEISLVSELMDCDLSGVASQLSPKQKLVALLHVAKGLHFLHSSIPPVIHRDLKTANVLIGHYRSNKALLKRGGLQPAPASMQMICKIADLGVSTLALNKQHTTQVGTAYIMAPEVLHRCNSSQQLARWQQQQQQQQYVDVDDSEPSYGTEVDIYAWAIIANELWTGNPFMMADADQDLYRFASKFDDAIRDGTLRPQTSPDCPAIIVNLIKECWSSDPSLRPTAQELCRRLRRILRMSDQLFPEPDLPPAVHQHHDADVARSPSPFADQPALSVQEQFPARPSSRNMPVSPRPTGRDGKQQKKTTGSTPQTPLLSAMTLRHGPLQSSAQHSSSSSSSHDALDV